MCLILHRVLSVVAALVALLVVIISPIVIGTYADVRNWNGAYDGAMRWCHDDAKMADHAGNLGLAAGCVSFVVGIVLIPLLLVTFVGSFVQSCRPNVATSYLVPLPVFLLSLVLYGLYASVVATTSRQFEERKDWERPVDWPDSETDCHYIPPKWNNALAWAVIQAGLCGILVLYSVLWMLLGLCESKEESSSQTVVRLRSAGVIFHRILASVVALMAFLVVIISPIVIGSYADIRNWNDTLDGALRWCHDDAKMADHAGNLGLAAGCVSFVLGLILIPLILVTVLGACVSFCRRNAVTNFVLPLPVFLISLVLFSVYVCVVAVTSRQFEEKKDWERPADWPDTETDCSDIPPKWENALAWAVIQAGLCGLILLYSVVWLVLGACAKPSEELEGGVPMEKIPKSPRQKSPRQKSPRQKEASESSESSDESDSELKDLSDDLKATLRTEFDDLDAADRDELQLIEKSFQKNRVFKRKRFLKLQESDLKKMGLSEPTSARLQNLIASERAKDKDRKRRRDRGYIMIDLDDTLKSVFNEADPKERQELEEVRVQFRHLKITDLDFFINMTEKEFKQLELPHPTKNKLRQKIASLKEAEDV